MIPGGPAPLAAAGFVLSSHDGGGSNGLMILGFGFLVGLACIYVGAKKWRVGRLIKNTPTQRARSVAVGRAELSGVCRDVGTTYAQPYSDGECVYRHWEVEEYQESTDPDDNSSEWVTVDSGTDVAPFFVEDDTGQVLVDTTQGPQFEISEDNCYSTKVDAHEEAPPEVRSFHEGSGNWMGIDEDTSPAEAMEKMPFSGKIDGLLGGSMQEMMEAGSGDRMGPKEGTSGEEMQRQFMQRHFDDEVLDENGQLREDVSEAELQAAMDDDVKGMGPSDMFAEMAAGGASDGDDTGGDNQQSAAGTGDASAGVADDSGTANGDRTASGENGDQGTPDVVEELGGTGTTGSMGTGTSIAGKVVGATLGEVTGGRLGTSTGGGSLLGSGGSVNSYNKRQFSHEVLPVDEDVYAFGEAQPRDGASGSNAARLKLGQDETTDQFIVSDQGEKEVVKQYTLWGPLWIGAGILVSAGCLGGMLAISGIV